MEATSQSSSILQPRPPAHIAGREREQRLLSDLLVATADGSGRLALVGGEAGIGKTALVSWIADEALRHGALMLSGGCYDLTATPPYGPWLDAFERYEPAAGAPSTPLLAPEAIPNTQVWFDTIHVFLSTIAASQPLVVVLEDLHWSDPASLDLLRHVARKCRRLPVMLVGTYRDDEITREHPLFQLLPLLVREADAERIDLRRLDRPAILATIAGRYDLSSADQQRLVGYLGSHSDGNPLFLTELLRTLESEQLLHHDGERWILLEPRDTLVPPLLHQVIDRRLGRLRSDTRDALAIAAIIGYEVPVSLWATVSGLTDEQLAGIVEEAVEAHVLEELPDGSGLCFSHALVREAIYGRMALPRRRIWHRHVADALASTSNPTPDEVAFHLQQAGDDRAVEWLVRAGLRARRAEAWITAADRFAVAARLLEGDEARLRERGWLLLLSNFLLRHSNAPQVMDGLDEAERISVTVGDPVLNAYARHVRGGIASTRGEIRRGIKELSEAVTAIDALLERHDLFDTQRHAVLIVQRLLPEADQPDAGRSESGMAVPRVNHQRGALLNWIAHSGPYPEVVTGGTTYLAEMNAAFGTDFARMPQNVTCHHGMGLAYAGLGMPDAARRHFALARAISAANNDYVLLEQSIWSELLMALIPYQTDNLAERSRLVAEAVRTWDRCRGITIATAGDGPPSQLRIDVLEGHWKHARKLATDHLSGPWIGHIQGGIVTLGVLDRHQGNPDAAWQHVAQLLLDGSRTEPGDCYIPHVITAIRLAADLALDANDLTTAQQWIETHERWLDWSGAILWRADTQILLARYHERSGDLSLARQHAESALRCASNPRQPLRIVAAHRMLGHLDRLERQYDDAAAHLDQSLTLATACAAPFEQALSLLELAELRACTGQSDEARSLLDHVRSICVPLDARQVLERVAELEARIGVNRPYPDGLTAREVEVLRLIAAGHSNRAIADTLFISPRTIERHIANIYLKIDAHNKAEATSYARSHHLA